MKVPNFTFCGGSEYKNRLSFSFHELRCSLLELRSRKTCQHLTPGIANQTKWNNVMKFEAARIHFLSDGLTGLKNTIGDPLLGLQTTTLPTSGPL